MGLISNMKIVFQNSVSKIAKKAFLVPNLCIFAFSRNFANRKMFACWFPIWQYFFKILAQKYPIRHFWSKIPKSCNFGPKFRHFCFFAKFCNKPNSRVLISSSNSKIPISGIFGLKFRHFCVLVKFCKKTNLKVLI